MDIVIRKCADYDERTGDFINKEFTDYGLQCGVKLNFEEFCFVAEEAFRGKGYDIITLTTFGFQAPEFYRKLGYKVEYVRECKDPKLSKYFLSKKLCPHI